MLLRLALLLGPSRGCCSEPGSSRFPLRLALHRKQNADACEGLHDLKRHQVHLYAQHESLPLIRGFFMRRTQLRAQQDFK